jgi:SAM-dependent methyltransferase
VRFDESYYETVYRNYERQNPSRKLAFYRRLVERQLRAAGNPRVLDLGCAFGFFLAALDSRFRKYGVDASEHAIRQAKSRLPGAGLAIGDCAAPPFRGPFDAITAFDVMEHIPDLERVWEFAGRALAPGGVLVFAVPVYDGPLGPLVHRLDRDPTHVHKQSRRWWLDKASARFEVIAWTGILRYLAAPCCYLHVPSTVIRSFSPAIAVVARPRG